MQQVAAKLKSRAVLGHTHAASQCLGTHSPPPPPYHLPAHPPLSEPHRESLHTCINSSASHCTLWAFMHAPEMCARATAAPLAAALRPGTYAHVLVQAHAHYPLPLLIPRTSSRRCSSLHLDSHSLGSSAVSGSSCRYQRSHSPLDDSIDATMPLKFTRPSSSCSIGVA